MKSWGLLLQTVIACVLLTLFASNVEAAAQSYVSGGTIAAGARVKLSGATVVQADVGDESIGVVNVAAVVNQPVLVVPQIDGQQLPCLADGAISAGADVYPATNGLVSATVSGKRIGKALDTTTTSGDKIRVLCLAPAGDRTIITFTTNASSVDTNVFVCDRPYTLVNCREIHSVVGSTSAAVIFRKITDTSAPGAAASSTVKELMSAAFDLTATINTTQTATLVSTAGVTTFATGDRICADFSGTLTGLVGVVNLELKPK